ncbi:MAG: TRAM domain-containing protein [Candidatus Omnitrophica bacterium]|nr:TRAM domain-containing protein [Candidatus Omnitrophota bacterium]
MTLHVIRIFFIFVSIIVGFQIGGIKDYPLQGAAVGLIAMLILITLESGIRRISVRGLSSLVFGLILGLIMAKVLSDIIALLPLEPGEIYTTRVVLTVFFCYIGSVMALRGRDEFNIIIPYVKFKRQDQREDRILLDTSAIIDGRIVDIYKAKFLESRLIVPRFVLAELQQVADSSDPIKRQRGRRGLEMLQTLQKESGIDLKIHEEDISSKPGDTDTKLVNLAKVLEAKVATTDFNLNRVAGLQGVTVLNVNELANALKPIVFPGESMQVRLIKEGKEHNQGIGYLDDGTMIVVEDAKRLVGQMVKVNVTSVLQTQAGRMIFTKLENK